MATYTPPVGNNIQFDFTQEGYYPPVWSAIDFDFDNSDYRAEDPITMYLPSTWRMNPTGTGYIRPYFRCTYKDINSTGRPVTDVEINVYDSDGSVMWQSGVLNFKDFLDAAHSDPPYPDRYAYDGAEITVKYALNLNWDYDPSATVLTRDGLDYHWEMHFYVDSLGVFTSYGRGSFNMFEELWQPRDLTCEGLINPTDITDITPEFAATLWSQYVPSVYTPHAKSYRIWVSTDSSFSSIMWDSGWTTLSTPIAPGESTPQISYAGTALERNGTLYYWRMRFLVDVEWSAVDATSYISDTSNYTMLLEYYRLINPLVDWISAPTALKDYHPKFNATFSDNYSGARANKVQILIANYIDTSYDANVRCYRFDSSDQISIGDKSALRITGDLTIEFWIRASSTSNRTNIVDKCYWGEYALTLETNGSLSYYNGSGGSSSYISRTWGLGMTYGNWYHVAIVRTNASSSVRCYIATANIDATHSDLGEGGTGWMTPAYVAGQSVLIGRGYAGNTFQGDICQVRIWDKALSLSEINNLDHLNISSGTANLQGYWKLDETSGNALDSSGNNNTGTISGTIERRTDGPLFRYPSGYVDWDHPKWDSDWVNISSVSPGDACQQIAYPDPYPSGDEGFYYDGSIFYFKMRFYVESDGVRITDWSQTYSNSYFTMGIANIVCVDPRVDGMSGVPRVLSFNPYFDAVYSTDDIRALDYEVYIQVATGSDMSGIVWDSGYLSFTPGISHGDRSPLQQIPEDTLVRDIRYYWRIRFRNERSVVGSWSSICLFDCIGWVISNISQNDAITIIRGGKEYEARVESRDNYIYYWLWNVTDNVYLFTEHNLNVGGLPRIKYDSDADEFILLWELNKKMYKRSWDFSETPESASTVAPQLIECTYYPVTINHITGYNNYDYAHCPYAPTSVTIRRGTIIRWGGVDYRDGYLVRWNHAADHVLYDNTMVGEFKKHYEIYLDRLREVHTLPDQTIIDAVPETIIYSICGTEVVTKQKFLYPEHNPCQDEWVASNYARGSFYPGREYSILDGWGPYQQNGENSAQSTNRGFQASYNAYVSSNIPVKQVYRYLDDTGTHVHQSTNTGILLESYNRYDSSNIPVKRIYRMLDDEDYDAHQSTNRGFLVSYNTLVTYSGGYIR